MSKRSNPIFKSTAKAAPIDPDVLPAEVPSFDETFPGGGSLEPPLSVREQKRLSELEAQVTDGILAFVDAGNALREIHEKEMFRGTHKRFDFYVKDMWDMDRVYAYRLIDAVNVLDNIQNALPEIEYDVSNWRQDESVANWQQDLTSEDIKQIKFLPQNEAQARALSKYKDDPEKQIEIWKEALRTMKNGRMTASHIRATAQRLIDKRVKKAASRTRKGIRKVKMSEGFRAAFDALLEEISTAIELDWAFTSQGEVTKHLTALLETVADARVELVAEAE